MTEDSFEKTLIILGTARSDSYTLNALINLASFNSPEIIELHKLKISPYNYSQPAKDDFLQIAEKMTQADVIVFATPVYWYSMSGFLKVFFDRLTDLISTSKNVGRGLAGKKVYLFATGSDAQLPEGFEVPFIKTSEYFNMKYQRAFYICTADKK
ncbi:MAG: flavodoxin family protein [Pirellula sp.]